MKNIVTFFVLLFSIIAIPDVAFAVKQVRAIAVNGNNIYVGGEFTAMGGVAANGIAKWDGIRWSPLGTGVHFGAVAGAEPIVLAIAVNGNDVFVGGQFVNAGDVAGTSNLAKWNGSSWSSLDVNVIGVVRTITISGSDIYFGGSFTLITTGGDTIYSFAKWNGSSWSSLGLEKDANRTVYAIVVRDSNVYIAGNNFAPIGGVTTNIGKWDGHSWSSLGSGLKGLSGSDVLAIAINDSGEVYAGGNYFTWAAAGGEDSLNYIAKWKGSSWDTTLGKGYGVGNNGPGLFSEVRSIVCRGSDVSVASTVITGEKYSQGISKWDGNNWFSFGAGVNGSIYAMVYNGNDLYVGGHITTAGVDSVNEVNVDCIARWDGSKWFPVFPLANSVVSVNQTAINFGSVFKDSVKSNTLKITNAGASSILVIDSVYTKTPWLTATLQSDTLLYGDTTAIVISFLPNEIKSYIDTLYIANSSATTPLVKVPLKGNGVNLFQVVFLGATLDFGNIAVQDSSVQSFMFGNLFSSATTIDSIYTQTSIFSVTPKKLVLNLQDTLNLVVTFKPKNFLTYSDTIIIENRTLLSAIMITVKGKSPSPTIALSTQQVDFGSIKKDSSVSKTITITNSSINNLFIDSLFTFTGKFNVIGNSTFQTVKRGDTLKVTIVFSSSLVGPFSDTLYIKNNSQNTFVKVPLSGIATPTLGITEENSGIPKEFALHQNYPNPFNPSTVIVYQLPKNSFVTLKVYDVLGKEFAELVNEDKEAGHYEVKFNASKLSSGIYFYRITAGSFTATKKLLLMK